jgi:acetate kinase
MKILVANLGSTSFKYRLLDMESERQLARGGVERIGAATGESSGFVEIDGQRRDMVIEVPDHAVAVKLCLAQLTDPEHGCLQNASEVSAIGFKAVHGGRFSGVQRITGEVLDEMETMNTVAPAHNPPYIRAMRQLAEKLPDIPLVAAFETGFHQTIPESQRNYAIPRQWANEYHVKRWGFHGASHRYISIRTAEILERDDLRVISCHLGGSNSLCGIRNGESIGNTLGMSPQSGLPHNNRVGDFDPFALPVLIERTGKSLDQILEELANHSGLLGVSGISGDIRDIEAAAAEGHEDAQLALDLFIDEIRRHLGGLLIAMGGADVIVFTGGIGENSTTVRTGVCRELDELGIQLDADANRTVEGESAIHATTSRTQIWVVPTNEEIVVARQTKQLLEG